jgi:hypothetical protein
VTRDIHIIIIIIIINTSYLTAYTYLLQIPTS